MEEFLIPLLQPTEWTVLLVALPRRLWVLL